MISFSAKLPVLKHETSYGINKILKKKLNYYTRMQRRYQQYPADTNKFNYIPILKLTLL